MEAASVAASTLTAEPRVSVLASSVIAPSTSSTEPKRETARGPNLGRVGANRTQHLLGRGRRCHATSTPSSDGSDMVSALPESENRVLAPLRSRCAQPVTSSPAIAPGDGLEIDGGPCLTMSKRRLKGTPRAWWRLEADQHECLARIVAHHRAFARKRQSSWL